MAIAPQRGAADDAEAALALREPPITERDRDHWSFRPIERPPIPVVQTESWPKNDLDRFILHRLEREGRQPAAGADRRTLLRRLKFDLLGLPPTPQEITRFVEATEPDAYGQWVDRMLCSPAYGERWAQHWLDLARFAETDGFEHDKRRDGAWRYRQWVVDALNADMPYDQFVRLQLTGDLTGRPKDAVATVFCTAGPDMPDINEQDLRRHDKMNEIASTVGAVLLGLQVHCAQCHDHKFDPISQADFYRLRGIFEAAVPKMKRDRHLLQLSAQDAAVAPWLYRRGELSRRGPRLEPRPPRIACSESAHTQFDDQHPRKAFADWLFSPANPLTARVIANRIWQHHFGHSLTENPSDFGVIAGGPSHPQLLDWLASELRRSNWSLKHLHRMILLSATYQQASLPAATGEPATAPADPDLAVSTVELYDRFPRRRLEGEVVRDALLAVSGQLNRQYGGPSVMPPLPRELVSTLLKGQWETSPKPADHARRSIYVFARRNLRYPLFDVFDRPDAGASCPQRDRSTTAIQALQMLNSEITYQAAVKLRQRLQRELRSAGDEGAADELVDRLFLVTLSRYPSATERSRLRQLLTSPEMNQHEALLAACLAVLNTNEFLYVD